MNSGAYASKGSNWVKFTNGLIIQWGDIGLGNNPQTVTLPQPFSNSAYGVVGIIKNTGYYSDTGFVLNSSRSSTSFSFYRKPALQGACWIAIGY